MTGAGTLVGLGRKIDLAAASLFAGAVGYSTLALSASPAGAAVAGAAAFLAVNSGLGAIEDQPHLALPAFTAVDWQQATSDPLPELLLTELPELLLTELAELLLTDVATDAGDRELLLEERLIAVSDESRVIRLFDPRTLPTAGEMHDQIERHLGQPAAPEYPDATGELHQALAALRKSLR